LIGDLLISRGKLENIRARIEAMGKPALQEALEIIREEGGDAPYQILEALGYGVRWRGLDPGAAQLYRKEGR
jgi:hypothetical protein